MKESDASKETEENEPNLEIEHKLEKEEEEKLKAKYPQGVPKAGGSSFLQKRLQQRKYFDSGDYNMAKAKGLKLPMAQKQPLPPQKEALAVVVDDDDGSTSPTGCEIPTIDRIPARKVSMLPPEVGSKLSSQPLLHHQSSLLGVDDGST